MLKDRLTSLDLPGSYMMIMLRLGRVTLDVHLALFKRLRLLFFTLMPASVDTNCSPIFFLISNNNGSYISCNKMAGRSDWSENEKVKFHRWALTPISVISDIGLSLISNVRYRTEELKVRHYIGYRNKLLSDIRYPTLLYWNPRSAVVSCLVLVKKVVSSKPVRKMICQLNLLGSIGNYFSILDIGISDIDLVRYRNGSLCRYRNYSDIGIKGFSPTFFVPISE